MLKSEFARDMAVSAARVSQWLSEGKITGEAIEGEGRGARIRPDIARRQLRERLHVDQRLGLNGLSTRLGAERGEPEPAEDSVEAKIKAEKLFQVQLQTERLLEERRLARGHYVRAAEAREEMTRLAAKLLAGFEGLIPSFAAAVAEKLGAPNRDILHALREAFRAERAAIAAHYAAAAAAAPERLGEAETYDEPARPQ